MLETELISFIQEWLDLVDGTFFWKKNRRGGIRQGQLAGKLEPTGYRRIQICGKAYYQHRLVWLMYTGSFPKGVIDHINHNRADNAFLNLRDVSRAENQRNRSKSSNNSSGVTGVCCSTSKLQWMQYINTQNCRKTLGYYQEFQDAVKARKSQEIEYNYHENHGS